MQQFRYDAFDEFGKRCKGEVRAGNEAQALDMIAAKNLIPVAIEGGSSALPWWQKEVSLRGEKLNLPLAELLEFFDSISVMLNAGFGLTKSLAIFEAQTRNTRLARFSKTLRLDLENGSSLKDAMNSIEGFIPKRYQAVLVSGEVANKLAEVAADIARRVSKELTTRQEIHSALVYPIILMAMSLGVLGVIVFFLTPALMPVFTSAGAQVPLFVLAAEAVRTFLQDYWFYVFSIASLIVGFVFWQARRMGDIIPNSFFLIPSLGNHLKRRECHRILSVLSMSINNGTQLVEALSRSRSACLSAIYAQKIDATYNAVREGAPLASSLATNDVFASEIQQLLAVGEESGNLGEMLTLAETRAEAGILAETKRLTVMITPVLTIVIGLLVGGIILSAISAILDVNQIAF